MENIERKDFKVDSSTIFLFLFITILLLPNFFAVLFSIGNLKIPAYFFAIVISSLLLIPIFIIKLSNGFDVILRMSKFKASYIIFYLVICSSYFYSASKIDALDKLVFIFYNTLIPIFIFEIYFSLSSKTFKILTFLNHKLSDISYFLIFFSFITFIIGFKEPFADGVRWTLKGIANPIWFARFVGMLLLIILISEKKKTKFLFILSSLLAVYLIYLSGSRGPLIAVLLIVLINMRNSLSLIRKILYIFILTILIILGFKFSDGRLFTLDLFSINERINFLSYFSLDNFPIINGYGLGSFGIINFGVDGQMLYPHNLFLELFFETGLLGLFSFLFILFFFLKNYSNSLLYSLTTYFLINSQFSGDLASNNNLFILIYLLSNEKKNIISNGFRKHC